MEQNAAFPQRLQTLREKRRLSRRTLAELCGLSKNMISLYERGEKAPSVDALINLADFFGVSTDYLLGRKIFRVPTHGGHAPKIYAIVLSGHGCTGFLFTSFLPAVAPRREEYRCIRYRARAHKSWAWALSK